MKKYLKTSMVDTLLLPMTNPPSHPHPPTHTHTHTVVLTRGLKLVLKRERRRKGQATIVRNRSTGSTGTEMREEEVATRRNTDTSQSTQPMENHRRLETTS